MSKLIFSLGFLLVVLSYGPLIKDEVWYKIRSLKNQNYVLDASGNDQSAFASFLTSSPILLDPVNKDFSVVIEKIGVNAPVVADVPITDEKAYLESLKNGVAHASISSYPSQDPGNVYLFAHASVNFWRFGKYATVFNLLKKLEIGDKIHIFYKDQDFVYKVVNKEILPGWNTYPITRPVIEPTLTIQTCDPPASTINRLVVTANLVETK